MATSPISHIAKSWLFLSSIKGVAPRTWLELIAEKKLTAQELVDLPTKELVGLGIQQAILEKLATAQQKWVDKAVQWSEQHHQHGIVCIEDKEYPPQLLLLASPPLVLFCTGNRALLSAPTIAMVGSRAASASGRSIARDLASQLSVLGVTVVSGLASGIDAAAHSGALSEVGSTIAFIGTGSDIVYPQKNRRLHAQIIEQGGLVVSEFWPGTPPRPYHFPRRNRIIAALTYGVVVVEAKIKSGTLITANLAADLGKEVFAVPGHIYNPGVAGNHRLIQQGAKLVTNVIDIVEELPLGVRERVLDAIEKEKKIHAQCLASDPLLDSVDYDVTAVSIIAERNDLPVPDVLAALLKYELRGLVTAVPGGYVKLRGK